MTERELDRIAPERRVENAYIPRFAVIPAGAFRRLSQATKTLLTIILLLFLSPESISSAQTISHAQLQGCWRQQLPKKDDEKRNGFSDLCFRPNGTAYYASISRDGGGDELLKWRLIAPRGRLVIDEQSCLIAEGSNEATLFLTRCLYHGAWVHRCYRMTAEGDGCADRK